MNAHIFFVIMAMTFTLSLQASTVTSAFFPMSVTSFIDKNPVAPMIMTAKVIPISVSTNGTDLVVTADADFYGRSVMCLGTNCTNTPTAISAGGFEVKITNATGTMVAIHGKSVLGRKIPARFNGGATIFDDKDSVAVTVIGRNLPAGSYKIELLISSSIGTGWGPVSYRIGNVIVQSIAP